MQGAEGLGCFEAIHYWHVQVHQDNVILLCHALNGLYGLLPVHGGLHLNLNNLIELLLRDLLKKLLQNKEVVGGIVHTQDLQGLLRL